jgi:hypothetical protein
VYAAIEVGTKAEAGVGIVADVDRRDYGEEPHSLLETAAVVWIKARQQQRRQRRRVVAGYRRMTSWSRREAVQ